MTVDGINPSSINDATKSAAEVIGNPSQDATPAQKLEQELQEVDAAIDEAWELLEPSMRYLSNR